MNTGQGMVRSTGSLGEMPESKQLISNMRCSHFSLFFNQVLLRPTCIYVAMVEAVANGPVAKYRPGLLLSDFWDRVLETTTLVSWLGSMTEWSLRV